MKMDTDSILKLVSSNSLSSAHQPQSSAQVARSVLDKLSILPIKKCKILLKSEKKLGEDEIRKEFTIYLQSFGGKNLEEVIDRIMRRIFEDSLGCRFSYLGRRVVRSTSFWILLILGSVSKFGRRWGKKEGEGGYGKMLICKTRRPRKSTTEAGGWNPLERTMLRLPIQI